MYIYLYIESKNALTHSVGKTNSYSKCISKGKRRQEHYSHKKNVISAMKNLLKFTVNTVNLP